MKLKDFINKLPDHYIPIKQPYYKGSGEHSVRELEELCKQFTEYCHQQALIIEEAKCNKL